MFNYRRGFFKRCGWNQSPDGRPEDAADSEPPYCRHADAAVV